eukprot:6163924-Karenia_brevis.AAC.1
MRTVARYGLRGVRVGEASHPGPEDVPETAMDGSSQSDDSLAAFIEPPTPRSPADVSLHADSGDDEKADDVEIQPIELVV